MVSCKLCSAVYISSVVCFVVLCVLYRIMCVAFCLLCCVCQNWKWWRMIRKNPELILKMSSGWKQKNCQDMHFIEQAVLIFAKLKAGDGRGSPHLVRLSISV